MPKNREPKLNLFRILLGFLLLNWLFLVPSIILNFEIFTLFPEIGDLDIQRGPYGWLLSLLIRRDTIDFFRLTGDLIALLLMGYGLVRLRIGIFYSSLFLTLCCFLLLHLEVYDQVSIYLNNKPPVIASDILLLTPLWHFLENYIGNSFFWIIIGSVVMYSFFGYFLFHLIKILLNFMMSSFSARFFMYSLGFYLALVGILIGFSNRESVPKFIIAKIVQNVQSSFHYIEMEQKLKNHSPDKRIHKFASLNLDEKPNIILYVMESYGDILIKDDRFKNSYQKIMTDFEDSLKKNDWGILHNYSKAPVYGGKSWLSVATLLTGISISNQNLYNRFLKIKHKYPHLPYLFQNYGYQTTGVWPNSKDRANLKSENIYKFDNFVAEKNLKYTGKSFGWGSVPDQYSLNFTHNNYFGNQKNISQFLFYMSVSTHTPWLEIPPIPEKWRDLNRLPKNEKKVFTIESIWLQMKNSFLIRTYKKTHKNIVSNYIKLIEYEFKILEKYIKENSLEETLIVVVGDHQPPLLERGQKKSFYVPIHILSKDSSYLNSFFEIGFSKEQENINPNNYMKHEGLYSLIIDQLSKVNRKTSTAAKYYKDGFHYSALNL